LDDFRRFLKDLNEDKMTDQEIVTGLRQGERRVYDYLYQTFGGKVMGYVMKNSGSAEDAEDVLQEVLLKLHTAIHRYDEQGKFAKWFFTIVGNTWLNILRGRKTEKGSVSLDDVFHLKDEGDESLERVVAKERKYEMLYNALEKLEAKCSSILRLFHFEDKSSKEIADAYNMEDGTVRVNLKRCRDKWVVEARNMLNQLDL
jgi:RNA polymerase sigma factor (sigma-70 family)